MFVLPFEFIKRNMVWLDYILIRSSDPIRRRIGADLIFSELRPDSDTIQRRFSISECSLAMPLIHSSKKLVPIHFCDIKTIKTHIIFGDVNAHSEHSPEKGSPV